MFSVKTDKYVKYVGRELCKNVCSEMMIVLLVVARRLDCYVCLPRTSLPLVLSVAL
jgi:hypothetical protein